MAFALKRKVVFTTIVGILAISAIYFSVGRAFERISVNIDRLAEPNERLLQVNKLFRGVSQLNQLQQKDAASGRRTPSAEYKRETNLLYQSIDTLEILFEGDSLQLFRLNNIWQLLRRSEVVFKEYMSLQYRHKLNPDINTVLTRVSDDIRQADSLISSIVQTQITTTTTTVSLDTIKAQKPGFLQRLFGGSDTKKVDDVVNKATKVEEQVKFDVDTSGIFQADHLFQALGSSLDSVQAVRLHEAAELQTQEFRLLNVNSNLIHQLINIINELEQEEINQLNAETQSAFRTAGDTIQILNLIAVVFVVVTLVLVLIVLMDISKSNKYRDQLEAAHEAARQEAAAKQRFLSNMSHEIRTPLQSIFGYAEQAKLARQSSVDLEAVYHPAMHLLEVVDEVLDYAKVTSGELSFASEPFRASEELSRVLKSMRQTAQKKNIKLDYEFEGSEEVLLLGDAFRLRQIVYNLVGNALKFTKEGGVKVKLEVKEEDGGFGLKLAVSDTGIGIEPERMALLFKEFSQADAGVSSHYGGTGLGLSIVKNMVELQGGRVEVESAKGEGSTFSVYIPYPGYVGKEQSADEAEAGFVKPQLVWMADDDAMILKLGEAILKKHEIDGEFFDNGHELLKAFDKRKPDVVILDMRMPGMSGLEVCEKIRARVGEAIRIFALTAQVLPQEREEMLAKGFDGIVSKPFKEADLLAVMHNSSNEGQQVLPDISNLEKMAGGDRDLVASILMSIRDESLKDLAMIKEAFDNDDSDALLLIIHRMAGRSGQCGAMEYSRLLREAELELRSDSVLLSPESVDSLLTEGEKFVASIETILSTKQAPGSL